jgi:hypothetical protein
MVILTKIEENKKQLLDFSFFVSKQEVNSCIYKYLKTLRDIIESRYLI